MLKYETLETYEVYYNGYKNKIPTILLDSNPQRKIHPRLFNSFLGGQNSFFKRQLAKNIKKSLAQKTKNIGQGKCRN